MAPTRDFLIYLFNELCKGNSSVISLENNTKLSEIAMKLYKPESVALEGYSDCLKYLIMICNILYNRTDMTVLPVEDGLYDILLERYKSIDPNFQVGAVVVQFKSQMEKEMVESGKQKIITPITFDTEKRDETGIYFEDKISSFYRKGMMSSRDPFYTRTDGNCSDINKRTTNTEHNHPDLIGTLDKCKFVLDCDAIEKDVYDDDRVKILERDWFRKHIDAGIISENEEIELILELKYDGISVEADCTDTLLSARTRGDTGIGKALDITPNLIGYEFTNNQALKDRVVGVKFEAIMTKSNLTKFNMVRGYNYANCRTAIVGLFGASDAQLFRDYITLIPLALDRNDVPEVKDRMEEIALLNKVYKTKGQPLNYCYIKGNYKTCLYLIKKYAEEALAARNYVDFMFDGIVVTYADERIRNRLGRENHINKYQMAVKFDPLSKLTTFLGYTYEVGQNGTICPMIHYSPVEFFGTIHPKSTGSSYKRFMDLGLKIGDVIQVTYTNDVMPYVTSIDCEQNRTNTNPLEEFPKLCPVCGTPLIFSEKTAVCPNVECKGRKLARMVNMLQKLNFKGFADSSIGALSVYTLHDLFNLTEEQLQVIGPGNASNFLAIKNQIMTTPTEDYRLIGSLGFTNIGAKKWKLIFSQYTLKEFVDSMEFERSYIYTQICKIRGIGTSTANIILKEYDYFLPDIIMIMDEFNVIDSKNQKMNGKVIRFTGCRDRNLEQQLIDMGHDADGSGSVTKSTDILLVPYEGFQSTKISKIGPDTIVVPITDFVNDMSKYL